MRYDAVAPETVYGRGNRQGLGPRVSLVPHAAEVAQIPEQFSFACKLLIGQSIGHPDKK